MTDLQLGEPPVARAAMLIRRPVAEVFQAFVDPAVTAKFWFSRGSGRLEPGAEVAWHWDMYGLSVPVRVKAVEPNARILVEWPGDGGHVEIEWTFAARPDGTTFVSIANSGFCGEADAVVAQAIGATEGFALVLAGLKALLEHDVSLSLVRDRHPDGLGKA
jgi:uncharacterized protein YndB with AHSA1/START domain